MFSSNPDDKTAQVWDASTGRTLLIYRGHTDIVSAVTWSPDSTRIASAADEGTVQIWQVHSGHTIFTYEGHSRAFNAIAWYPNGKLLDLPTTT